jgi:hypothetical protein
MSLITTEIVRSLSSYSECIEKHLSVGDWEGLNTTLQERQEVLEGFFSQLNPAVGIEAKVVDLILQIQAEDSVFLRLLKSQKHELEKQFTSLKQGRKSVKAYQHL